MSSIAIVYHSEKGHTRVLAEQVASGIESVSGSMPGMVAVENAEQNWETLQAADAIIFGCPTYMGCVSGEFKMFMDQTSSIWFERKWQDKIAGAFTSSGSFSGDKLGTLVTLAVFAAQHGMIWVGPAEICASTSPDDRTVNRLGSQLGVMSQCDPYASPSTMAAGDLATARLYGERITRAVDAMYAGRRARLNHA